MSHSLNSLKEVIYGILWWCLLVVSVGLALALQLGWPDALEGLHGMQEGG